MDPDITDVTPDPLEIPSIGIKSEEPLCLPLNTGVNELPKLAMEKNSNPCEDSVDYLDISCVDNQRDKDDTFKIQISNFEKFKNFDFNVQLKLKRINWSSVFDSENGLKLSYNIQRKKTDGSSLNESESEWCSESHDSDDSDYFDSKEQGNLISRKRKSRLKKNNVKRSKIEMNFESSGSSSESENEKSDDNLSEYKDFDNEVNGKIDDPGEDGGFSSDSAGAEDIDLYENDEKFRSNYKCLTCNVTFCNKRHLKNHFKTKKHKVSKKKNRNKPFTGTEEGKKGDKYDECYKCSDCNLIFQSLKFWKNHLKSRKHMDVNFYCEICNISIINDKQRHLTSKNHLRLAGISFFCKFCEKTYETKEKFIEHCTESHPDAKVCPVCTNIFARGNILNHHMKIAHEGEKSFKCSNCDKIFGLEAQLKRHIREKHMNNLKQQGNLILRKKISRSKKENVKRSKMEMNYESAGLSSESENEKSDDNLSENKDFGNEVNGKTDDPGGDGKSSNDYAGPEDIYLSENDVKFRSNYENEKSDDNLSENKDFSNEVNGKMDDPGEYSEYFSDSAGPEDIDLYENEKFKNVYRCLACNVTFGNKRHLKIHFETRKHKLRKEKNRGKPYNGTGDKDEECYKCSACNLIFQSLKFFKSHLKSKKHMNMKYYCEICNVSTVSKQTHLSTKNHLRLAGISFFCKFCDKTYETKDNFIEHGAKSHPNAKICPVCTDIFSKTLLLNNHMKTAHEAAKSFKCSNCDEIFCLEAQLKRHMRKKHMNDFYCDECSIGFKSEQHLNTHIYDIHTAKEITVDIEIPELPLDIEGHHLYVEKQVAYVKKIIEQKHFEVMLDDNIEYLKKYNSRSKANEEVDDYFEWKEDEDKFNFDIHLNEAAEVKQDIKTHSESCVLKNENSADSINSVLNDIKVEISEDLPDSKNESEKKSVQVFHGNDDESKNKHGENEHVDTEENDKENEVKNEDSDNIEDENSNMDEYEEENVSEIENEVKNEVSDNIEDENSNMDEYEEENVSEIENEESEGLKDMKSYVKKKFKCDICNHRCSSKSELEKHMQKSKSKVHKLRLKGELKCEICIPNQIIYFTSVANWEKHANTIVHRKKSGDNYPCKFCNKMINFKEETAHNEEAHPEVMRCDDCGDVLKDKDKLQVHKKQNHGNKVYKCLNCNYTCKNFRFLKIHVIDKHDMTFVCSQCFMAFKQESQFAEHMEIMHPLKVFKCEPCAKSFYRERLYNGHFKKFHKKEGFQCNECGKCLSTKFSLKSHIERTHQKKKRYMCSKCGKGFYDQNDVDYHIRSKHNDGKKSFFCSVCGKGFVSQDELRTHNIIAHIKKQWTCKICSLEFGTKTDLNFHTKVDHENAPTYPCNECEKVFLTRQILKVHCMLSHSDMLRFICQICGKSILSQSIAKQHLKNDHNTDDTKYMKFLTKYKCRICNMPFENIPDLKKHRREDHNITNPYWYMLPDK